MLSIGSLGVGLIHHPRRQYLMTAALAFGVPLAATAGAPDIAIACLTLLATGATAFSFVTLCSTALQLHSSPATAGSSFTSDIIRWSNWLVDCSDGSTSGSLSLAGKRPTAPER
jgi:hypothetical protein